MSGKISFMNYFIVGGCGWRPNLCILRFCLSFAEVSPLVVQSQPWLSFLSRGFSRATSLSSPQLKWNSSVKVLRNKCQSLTVSIVCPRSICHWLNCVQHLLHHLRRFMKNDLVVKLWHQTLLCINDGRRRADGSIGVGYCWSVGGWRLEKLQDVIKRYRSKDRDEKLASIRNLEGSTAHL